MKNGPMMRQPPWWQSANWIWVTGFNDTNPEGQTCLFRRQFVLAAQQTEPCSLRVSADTRYRLYVNNVSVSVGPCKSHPGRWYYETVDIQPYLVQGVNVIGAVVLRFSDRHVGSLSLMRTVLPGLIVHCEVQDQRLHTDAQWQGVQDHSVTMASRKDWDYALGPPFMVLNEHVDGRKRQIDWAIPQDDLNNEAVKWLPVSIVTMRSMMMPVLDPWKLVERPIPPMEEVEGRFDGVVCCSDSRMMDSWNNWIRNGTPLQFQPGTTVWVELEVKAYTAAYLKLQCSAGASSRLEVLCSEGYESPMPRSGPGVQRVKGNRADYRNGKLYGTTDSYVTHEGVNNWEPFWFKAFRYVRLQISVSQDKPLGLSSFTFRTTYYPLDIKTQLKFPATISHDGDTTNVLEDMYNTSVQTLRNCMHETYEDCPFYEQNQFLMDSRLQMLFTYQLSRDDRLARKTMHEFHASRRADGLLQAQFPSPGRSVNIPMFSLFFVAIVHDHFLYFRDEGLVRMYMGTIDGILQYFQSLVDERWGLVGAFDDPDDWAFVDWVGEWNVGPPLHGMAVPPAYQSGPATIFSLVYAWALQLAADLAGVVNRLDTAAEYSRRAEQLIAAVNEHCFDEDKRLYTDGPLALLTASSPASPSSSARMYSQHCQTFAILVGAIKGEAAADLMLQTMDALKQDSRGTTMAKCSIAMSFYIFRAASKTNLYEQLWPELIKPWQRMLADDLVSFAETEDSGTRSDCHGWSAGPIYEVVAEIFGVKPTLEGGVEVKPKVGLIPGGMAGMLVSPKGLLRVGMDQRAGFVVEGDTEIEH
ncbi:Six-hairpin glycosidase [Sarocladium strictum]